MPVHQPGRRYTDPSNGQPTIPRSPPEPIDQLTKLRHNSTSSPGGECRYHEHVGQCPVVSHKAAGDLGAPDVDPDSDGALGRYRHTFTSML